MTFCSAIVNGQNVRLQVEITGVERSNYSDCGLCGNPDPAWIVTGYLGGVSQFVGTYTFGEMSGTQWIFAANSCSGGPCYAVNNASTSETQFVLGFDGWENDCNPDNTYTTGCNLGINSDYKRCTNANLQTVNFRNSAPCTWTTPVWGNWCSDFRFQYRYYWEFVSAPTIATQPDALGTWRQMCAGTPLSLNVAYNLAAGSQTWARFVQWQVSLNGTSGWTDISGATSISYTPPQTTGDRWYRVLANSNCTSSFASNTVTSNSVRVTYWNTTDAFCLTNQCTDVVYVAPTTATPAGLDANAGTADAPKATINGALALGANVKHIKILGGNIVETSVVNIPTGIVIEGGYTASTVTPKSWVKNSATATTITCSGSEAISSDVAHTIGFKASVTSGWTLQDLTIVTAAASGQTTSGNGKSNYAVYLNGASSYNINRCVINAGAASTGAAGTAGGNGVAGTTGGNGANAVDGCGTDSRTSGGSGTSGGAGGAGPNAGGQGGAGGNGGQGASDSEDRKSVV